jgi:hypothetical protein
LVKLYQFAFIDCSHSQFLLHCWNQRWSLKHWTCQLVKSLL